MMDDATGNIVAERLCAICGTPADTGLIFCKKCGTALRPPVPLIPLSVQDVDRLPHTRSTTKAILFIFLLCSVSDFSLGYVHERSIPAGVISVVGGLFGTAFYLFLWKWLWKYKEDTNSLRR
jgi:hypothetical protein